MTPHVRSIVDQFPRGLVLRMGEIARAALAEADD